FNQGTRTATSHSEPRKLVVCMMTVAMARSASPNGTLMTRTGRTFSARPQSHCQTSPRLGIMRLLLVEHRGEGITCRAQFLIGDLARIRKRQAARDEAGEDGFFLLRQRFVFVQELFRSGDHEPIFAQQTGNARNDFVATPAVSHP